MIRRVLDALEVRTGYRALVASALDERVPGGARFAYVFGSALAILFGLQALTGIGLSLYYSPSATDAWASVFYIEHKVALGYLLRGLHHYGSSAMIVVLGLHLLQTFTFGAHRSPRELVWWSGLVLLLLVLGFGLTGYLLPWDQKGYWATRVATGIASTTPLFGREIQYLIQGGNEYGNLTLTRFYSVHVVLLPALTVGLLAVHVALFRKSGGVTPSWRLADKKPDPPAARGLLAVVVAAFLFAAGLATASFLPRGAAWAVAAALAAIPPAILVARRAGVLSGKDDPRTVGAFWPDQLLRNALFALGVVAAVAILSQVRRVPLDAPADPTANYLPRPDWYFLFLFQLLKYFEGPFQIVGTMVIPGAVTLALFALPIFDRGPSRSPLSRARLPLVAFVYAVIAGAFVLTFLAVRDDAHNPEAQRLAREAERAARRAAELAQGGIPPEGAAALFAADPREQGRRIFAVRCAACHALDGGGGAKAPDLTGYLTREWLSGLIRNAEAPRFFGKTKLRGMDPYGNIGEEKIGRLADFLIGLADHDVPPDRLPEGLRAGHALYVEVGCDSCHPLVPGEEGAAPNLAGYGGERWLRAFVRDPGTPLFYDKDNEMPVFGKRLTAEEIDAVVAFLRDLAPTAMAMR